MSLPKGYSKFLCEGCNEPHWDIAVGPYPDQLAVICTSCDNTVHILVDGGELKFEGEM